MKMKRSCEAQGRHSNQPPATVLKQLPPLVMILLRDVNPYLSGCGGNANVWFPKPFAINTVITLAANGREKIVNGFAFFDR